MEQRLQGSKPHMQIGFLSCPDLSMQSDQLSEAIDEWTAGISDCQHAGGTQDC
jgi:hypothetical protein